MVISLSGLDGSGKSTQVCMLAGWLRSKGFSCAVVETHKLSLYSIFGSIIKRVTPHVSKKLLREHYRLSCRSRKRILCGTLRKFSFWADVGIFWCWVNVYKNARKDFILCDRFLLDEIIQLAYLGFCDEKNFTWYLKRLPMPDCPILLSVPPNIACNRNPEYPIEHYRAKDYFYRLSAGNVHLAIIEDATCEEMHRRIVTLVKSLF